jgi:hypothetical protein
MFNKDLEKEAAEDRKMYNDRKAVTTSRIKQLEEEVSQLEEDLQTAKDDLERRTVTISGDTRRVSSTTQHTTGIVKSTAQQYARFRALLAGSSDVMEGTSSVDGVSGSNKFGTQRMCDRIDESRRGTPLTAEEYELCVSKCARIIYGDDV